MKSNFVSGKLYPGISLRIFQTELIIMNYIPFSIKRNVLMSVFITLNCSITFLILWEQYSINEGTRKVAYKSIEKENLNI